MTDNTNTSPSLEDLKKLLASFSAADVKKLLKETEAAKPTMLSLTCEALVMAQLAGPVLTDSVTKAVTSSAREGGLLKSDENANGASVGQIIRICVAHDAAMVKAGYEWSKKVATPASDAIGSQATDESDKAPVEPVPAPEVGKLPNGRKLAA